LKRTAGTLAAILVLIWVVAPALPAYSRESATTTVPAAAEGAILPTWLRYSVSAGRDITGLPADEGAVTRELSRLADRLRPEVAAATDGAGVVSAFRRILLEEERFTYDGVAGNTENFLAGGVLARKRGNCLGMTLLWVSLAERLGVPFRGVYVPGHSFVRYEGEGTRLNVEFADGGASWEDERYLDLFRLSGKGPYLRSLSSEELLGVFLKSVGAAYATKGRNGEAMAVYAEAERLYPGLPDAHYNAAVSLQRLGRGDEAVAEYRQALTLDPGLVLARGNLGVLLAQRGRYAEAIDEGLRAVEQDPENAAARGSLGSTYCAGGDYDSGIREYRKALEIDPSNAQARAGLTRAWFRKGDYREAAREYERAKALGCRFEPSMRKALEPYRERGPSEEDTP